MDNLYFKEPQTEVVALDQDNLYDKGCYCLRSKPTSLGFINKNKWVMEKLDEGLKYIKIMEDGKTAGFIEYIPIENSSRVVYGENYLVIHCLWINILGKGYASKLINICIQDAKKQNKDGVIVVTNPDTSWAPSKEIFIKNNFIEIDKAPYGFELLINKFGDSPNPYFPDNWDDRLKLFNDLTVIRTQQCPFVDIATDNVINGARNLGISTKIINIESREELLRISPTPYGIYGVIFNNKLISFHRLTIHSVMKKLKELI